MTISFDCPHCGFHTQVAERFAGQSGSCANCQKPITLPGTAAALAPTARQGKPILSSGWLIVAVVLGLTVLGGVLFTLLFMVTVGSNRSITGPSSMVWTAELQTCNTNLERIGEAIAAYVEEKGHYPPAYIADKDGKPMHSWRVLLLPYLDEHKLFAKYDMSKPWDDPLNLEIVGRMPSVFRCPTEPDVSDESTYMVITGEDFLFDADKECTPAELRDAAASTLMVVEVVNSGIQWTEPIDLDIETIDWNRNRQKGLGSKHPDGGLHVLMADGTVHHFGDFVTPEALKAMATIDGGETVAPVTWSNR